MYSRLAAPVHTHSTMGMGYSIAMGQSFKHHTHTCTTCSPNTMGIPIPMPNPKKSQPRANLMGRTMYRHNCADSGTTAGTCYSSLGAQAFMQGHSNATN